MTLAVWTSDPRRQLSRSIVAAGCLYELAALYSPLPTITYISGRSWHWRRPLGPVAFVAATVIATAHFWQAIKAAGMAARAVHDLTT